MLGSLLSVISGAGLEAAGAVIRAGMLQAGCGMAEQLLAADPGCRGPAGAVRAGA
jgi:hypothetical protein